MTMSLTCREMAFLCTPAVADDEIKKTAENIWIAPPVVCAAVVLDLIPTATAATVDEAESTSTIAVLKRLEPLPLTYVSIVASKFSRNPQEISACIVERAYTVTVMVSPAYFGDAGSTANMPSTVKTFGLFDHQSGLPWIVRSVADVAEARRTFA